MLIPAAMNIYAGAAFKAGTAKAFTDDQLKELEAATPTLYNDYKINPTFQEGYLLGLATARAVILSSSEVLMHGADPAKVL